MTANTEAKAIIADHIRAANDKARDVATFEAEQARTSRHLAQQAFVAAHRALVKALAAEHRAVAKEAAANGVPAAKFIAAAVTNARTSSGTWSGGPYVHSNVIEALTRESWLDIADDAVTPSLFR